MVALVVVAGGDGVPAVMTDGRVPLELRRGVMVFSKSTCLRLGEECEEWGWSTRFSEDSGCV